MSGVLSKILDSARMRFSSVRYRRSARTGRRPRKPGRCGSKYPDSSANVAERPLRAARADRVFGADMKRIRTKNTVIVNTKQALGVYTSAKSIGEIEHCIP